MIELAETEMFRRFELTCRLLAPGPPVLDMMGAFACIEVDGGDAWPDFISATATCMATVDSPRTRPSRC